MVRVTPENPSGPAEEPASERLDSWKEIAAYLKRDARTVRRWEQTEQLPVHRHLHGKRGTVYAYKAEVDAWWNSGRSRIEKSDRAPLPSRRQRLVLVAGAALLMIVLGAAIYAAWQRISQPSPPAGRIMLAVLPFDNLSGDPEQEFLSDGITEEMITQLGRMKPEQLGVIARSSVMRYKRGERQLDQIRKELGVQYILEGSVRRAGNRVRISAQLIRATDQSHLWAQEYDRDLGNTLALQQEVAQFIAQEIGVKLAAVPHGPEAPRISAAAHEAFLRGMGFLDEGSDARAIEEFRKAIAADPNYARAYSKTASAYFMLGFFGVQPPSEAFPAMKEAALHALELDGNDAEAHASLAIEKLHYELDWPGAEQEFRRSLELNPSDSDVRHIYAHYLLTVGRWQESLAQMDRAFENDPVGLGTGT